MLKEEVRALDNILKKKKLSNQICKCIYFFYNTFYRNIDYRFIKYKIFIPKALKVVQLCLRVLKTLIQFEVFFSFFYSVLKLVFFFNFLLSFSVFPLNLYLKKV
jgi:hypothetical protein